MDKRGLKAATFSKQLGFSPTYIRDLLEKQPDPRLSHVIRIAQTLNVELNWLLFGGADVSPPFSGHALGLPKAGKRGENTFQVGEDYYTSVPVFDLNASAGAGALVEDENAATYQIFRESYLRSLSSARIEDLAVIAVSGDSMEPTLRHGDTILVDRSAQQLREDGIYVLLLGESLMVKRCQRDFSTDAVIVKSDNPHYDTMRVDDRERLQVKGRVIWVGRAVG